MNMPQDKIEFNEPQNSNATSEGVNIRTLMKDMVNLKDLLEIETELLKTMNISKVKDIHQKKLDLIRKIEIQKELIKRDKAILNSISPTERQYMEHLNRNMDIALKDNFYEALKAKEVNHRIIEVISQEVARQTNIGSGYGQNGCGNMGRNNGGSSVSLAISENI